MQFSAITLVLFAGVAILFVGGVGLIWVGLRSRPDRLPNGAQDILDAISEGRIAAPTGHDVDDGDGGSVRLIPRETPAGTRTEQAPEQAPASDERVLATVGPSAAGDGTLDDEDLTLTQKLFFAEEPELKKF